MYLHELFEKTPVNQRFDAVSPQNREKLLPWNVF